MKRMLSAIFVFLTSVANAAPGDGIRFDQHKTVDGYLLVVRGTPGQAADILASAYQQKAQALCEGALLPNPPLASEYPWIDGGNNFLFPAGGILLPMRVPHWVKQAPSLSGKVECPGAEWQAATPLRLAIDGNLGSVIAYFDQGFASFNREQLEVPAPGATFTQIAAKAVTEAFRERGYAVETAPEVAPGGMRIVIDKRPVSGEFFDGVVMMTKLNMFGIDERSVAFCSFRIAAQLKDASEPLILGQMNTRERIPPIYANWKEQMANGPSDAINAHAYEVLARIVNVDVKAVIHAIPAETLDKLVQP
ncbi:hypothetical protein GTP46_14790 [Duganella sp. FT135W]|uniref:DUF2066 domain-containing protein n=1 Tax=Duganella flavida TaxID=2692175 RepID=A0A6L8KB65_9BURK|nr:hypothetical protein [Duganella flavida]MYM23917.1 hypothetical protein [Duganella flavida]